MLIQLIKKDCLLVKRLLLVMLLFAIVVPVYISYNIREQMGQLSGFISFCIPTLFVYYFLHNSISGVETKYANAQSHLSATPYTRSLFITGKYAFGLLLFITCAVIFIIETLLLPSIMPQFSIMSVGAVFLILSIFISLCIPLEYKFGYGKVQYIYAIAVVLSPTAVPALVKYFMQSSIDLTFLLKLPLVIQNILPFVIGFIMSFISLNITKSIYLKKDL